MTASSLSLGDSIVCVCALAGFVTNFLAQYNLSWPPAHEPAARAAQEERSVVDLLVELSLVRGVHLLLRIVPDVYFKRRGYYSLHVEFNLAFMYEWAAVRKLLLASGRLAPFFEITALLLSGRCALEGFLLGGGACCMCGSACS